jgi:uncharacterized protein YrrD
VTRWHVLNLPVYVTGSREPCASVGAVWVDWEARRVASLMVALNLFGAKVIPLGPAVSIDADGVRIAQRAVIERRSRRWARRWVEADWHGREVVDGTGRLLGHVKDVEFDPKTGSVTALWLSRGILADVWHGMALVGLDDVRVDARRIVVTHPGQALL